SFESLMDKVALNPYEYFTFNDSYFMAKLHEFLAGRARHPMISELSDMLARRIPPAQVRVAPIKPTVIESEEHRRTLIKQCQKAVEWLKIELHSVDPNAWMIVDIPNRDVMFTRSWDSGGKDRKTALSSRDSVKVLTRHGELKLLVDASGSLMKVLSHYRNFIPRIYLSPKTYAKLEKKGVLEKMRQIVWE
ncbi:MAG: hypothetical protein ACXVA9_14380, partial [Bdellovibrionales bacterium]